MLHVPIEFWLGFESEARLILDICARLDVGFCPRVGINRFVFSLVVQAGFRLDLAFLPKVGMDSFDRLICFQSDC